METVTDKATSRTAAGLQPAPDQITPREIENVERALIDASTRVPVLMFYTSAIAWLLLGTLLAGIASWKLHAPDLLSGISYLTWGRVRAAHMGIMIYGWASMAGMGTAIWLMARLCRTTLRHPLLLVDRRGVLESRCASWRRSEFSPATAPVTNGSSFPAYSAVILFVAYLLIISWAVMMFRFRRGDTIYITQWYLLGAFLWFPWLYAAAHVMLFIVPVQGVMQAAVNWWYANNLSSFGSARSDSARPIT